MSRVARKVKDKRLLTLIRAYLQSGVMVNGGRDDGGGHTSRWSLKSAVGQHSIRRSGQEVGEKGTPFLPLCGRLQHMSKRTGERVKTSVERYLTRFSNSK